MARFDQESAIAAMELHQLIAEWGSELDTRGGLTVTRLCTQDCVYLIGGNAFRGASAVQTFYVDRGERVRTQQKDGMRTQRHTITNLQIAFKARDCADLKFIITNYSAEGKSPVLNLVGPTIIADCRMECRREVDGEWRISLFDSTPIFVGNDPFLNASVVQK